MFLSVFSFFDRLPKHLQDAKEVNEEKSLVDLGKLIRLYYLSA